MAHDPARAASLLIDAMRALSRARSREAVAEVVKATARKLVGSDGATFVLRDRDHCFYLDEDAISPLWKGQRFPLTSCVSGWVMRHAEQIAMPDIYVDPRVPHAAYRPTFVKSLVMTPVRRNEPVAAIGIYWSEHHVATETELKLLQDLADTTAVALENAQVYQELEQRVADRTEQLMQLNLELEAFAHTVAHDLRSPLNAVIGFAELLEEGVAPQATSSFAAEIVTAGRRMNALIGALLEFARSARGELQKRDVDLSAIARRVADQLRVQGNNPAAEVTIAPALHAVADEALIEVVLTNLLGNALKYSAKVAQPKVEVGKIEEAEGVTTFFVRDNGAGFDAGYADKLFRPFQRLHSQDEFPGHGIGLASVKRIIERHGGQIGATGSTGNGATFWFRLGEPVEQTSGEP